MRDLIFKIIDWENRESSKDQEIELFQRLIDSNVVWYLQGFYIRKAQELIENGFCHKKE